MYAILTPFRSIWKNKTRYLIFGILLLLLFALTFSVRVIGRAAEEESAAVIEKYGSTFLFYNLKYASGVKESLAEVVDDLPYVKSCEMIAIHEMNTASSIRLLGAPPEFWGMKNFNEGGLYQNDYECVINETYARQLRRTTKWQGIGDTITVRDVDNERVYVPAYLMKTENGYFERDKTVTLTVVGVIPDEETFFNSSVNFSRNRIYTTVATVEDAMEGIGENQLSQYSPGAMRVVQHYAPTGSRLFFQGGIRRDAMRPSDDGTHWVYLDLYTNEEKLLSDEYFRFAESPPNAGYVAVITIDSAEHAEDFRLAACGHFVDFDMPPFDSEKGKSWDEMTINGETKTWYQERYNSKFIWYAQYLIDDPTAMVESLSSVAPMCSTIARAAIAATAVLILLMTVLLVHDRQYEIGVLRCIGVTSGGVCGRFVAEIIVFLVIVAAVSLAVAVPAVRYAAGMLGLNAENLALWPTALMLLAFVGGVTVVSCVIAVAMILAKRPMEILNSRT